MLHKLPRIRMYCTCLITLSQLGDDAIYILPLTEGWNINLQAIKSVKKVFSETVILNKFFYVAVCRANYPNVHRMALGTTKTGDLPFLQYTK
ncbi:hypothetical protein D9M71_677620 [compost metagenome]